MKKIIIFAIIIFISGNCFGETMRDMGIMCKNINDIFVLVDMAENKKFEEYRKMLKGDPCVYSKDGQIIEIIETIPTEYEISFYKIKTLVDGKKVELFTINTEVRKNN